jgi:ABC-type oligopeptide transport system substrate-binding subunit
VDTTSAGCTSTDAKSKAGDYCNGEVVLAAHDVYWGGAPDIETLKLVRGGADGAAVAAALTAGTIDAVIGGRVLAPAHLRTFELNNQFTVVFGAVLYNSMILINSGKEPTDDIELRRTIIHAVNKAEMINDPLMGIGSDLAKAADRMFPVTIPHCDVELTPRWDYDLEMAQLLNCGPVFSLQNSRDESASLRDELKKEREDLKKEKEDRQKDIDDLKAEREELKVQLEDLQRPGPPDDDTASSASVLGLAACAVTYFF